MHCGFAVVPNHTALLVLVIAHTYAWFTFGTPNAHGGFVNGRLKPMAMKHSSGAALARSAPAVVVKPAIGCAAAGRSTAAISTVAAAMIQWKPRRILLWWRRICIVSSVSKSGYG